MIEIRKPDVSIIIPVYNGKDTIERALQSVFEQDFKGIIEVIVVDDGSTDGTKEILQRYLKRIKLISQKNRGPVEAANTAFANILGKYIMKLDADDTFERTIIRKMHSVLEKDKSLAFVYSNYYEVNASKSEKKVVNTATNLLNTVAIGIMFRKSILDEVGFYDGELIFPEYDLLLRLSKKYSSYHIPEPLFTYFRSYESLTGDKVIVAKGIKQLSDKYGELKVRGY
ncbi:glycosyltransferase [Candidatus Micrarchaeota archaeon]|nr:glycosyltransferase [Candidatus Micrarchaeota archaeon]